MAHAHPSLVGTWRVSEADQKQLETTLAERKSDEHWTEADAEAIERTKAHWQRLVLQIDESRIVGELGDGLETRTYSVRDSWTSDDGRPVVDLDLRGAQEGGRQVSVLFVGPDSIIVQGLKLRIPLQRTSK